MPLAFGFEYLAGLTGLTGVRPTAGRVRPTAGRVRPTAGRVRRFVERLSPARLSTGSRFVSRADQGCS